MGKSSLGRVLDPSALDASTGPRARLRVDVPESWLAEGAELSLTVPARLSCARCDGGGCDGCARSGALRAPEQAEARVVRAQVPRIAESAVAIRITYPFGADHGIEQLLVELRAAAQPSTMVKRIEPPRTTRTSAPSPALARRPPSPWPFFALVITVAAIVAALFGR